MARHRRSNYRHNTYSGVDYARGHLAQAIAFSREIGGNDKDVKEYFFSLPADELDIILTDYGKKFGEQPENYARRTFHAWKTGARGMSGLVAKRLFELLPHHMPLSQKYKLAENVWHHFGPMSSHYYTIGPAADIDTLANIVAEKLDATVTAYTIPEHIKNRFLWLAAGDVNITEHLLNHFRQAQKKLAIQKLWLEISVLQQQVQNHPDKTEIARSEIRVHKHTISISVNKKFADKIKETPSRYASSQANFGCILWFIFGVFFLFFLSR